MNYVNAAPTGQCFRRAWNVPGPGSNSRALEWNTPGGYYLAMSRSGGAQVAFTSSLTLDGWLQPDMPGHAFLLPIADAAGDGSIAALWRDGDAARVVLLGSDGSMGIIAEEAQEFLALLAIGYDELSDLTLGAEPEDPVDVREFRDWLEGRHGVGVPNAWPALGDDEFGAWMAAQLGEEPKAPTVIPSDSPEAHIEGEAGTLLELLGTADGPAAVALVTGMLGISGGETLRSSSRALEKNGVEVESTRAGFKNFWVTMQKYPRPAEFVVGLDGASTRDDVLALLGKPEKEGSAWVRYIVGGRYVHFGFDPTGALWRVTLMLDAP